MTIVDFESDKAVTTTMGEDLVVTSVVADDGKKVTKMIVKPGFDWTKDVSVCEVLTQETGCSCALNALFV
jgi:hypothetical protein